jgi:hypothetical protein
MVAKKAAEQEANAMLAAILAEHGIKNTEPETTHGPPVTANELDDNPQRVAFRGQAVLRSLEFPSEERLTKVCKYKECGNVFVSNYHSVAYCSVLCMEIELKKHFGLAWTPHARIKKERWEVRAEPEMIPMKALQAMKMIVARVEADLGHPIEIDSQAFSKIPSGLLKESESQKASESEPEASLKLKQISYDVPEWFSVPGHTVPLPSDKKKDQALSERLSVEEDDSLSFLFADEN